ncbi:MAG: hypothetical protein V1777_03830 [Candidatus Micrarchaeota archaeon]
MSRRKQFQFYRYAKDNVQGTIATYAALLVLSAVLAFTGTKFFGIDYLPWILLILAVVFIAAKYDDAKKVIELVKSALGR